MKKKWEFMKRNISAKSRLVALKHLKMVTDVEQVNK